MNSHVSEDLWIPTYDYQCNSGPCLIKVHRVNGVAVAIEGNTDFQGYHAARPCVKPLALIQKLYNPNRVSAPLKRTNPKKEKGADPDWVEISWDEALDLVAERLLAIRQKGLIDENGYPRLAATVGADGIPRGSAGTLEAFLAAWGPVDRELSGGGSVKCYHDDHLFGEFWHKSFIGGADTTRCNWVLACGSNTNASGGAPAMQRHGEARIRGMKTIQVDPQLSVTGATATEWIPIRPKTDAALLFAMIHVILHELKWSEVCDTDFLKRMTNSPYLVGPDGYFARDNATGKPLVWDTADNTAREYDSSNVKDPALEGSYTVNGLEVRPAFQLLREHIAEYTPEWASKITGVPQEIIRTLAAEFAQNAMIGASIEIDGEKLPCRPVAIVVGKNVDNGPGGYETVWARCVLQTLVGALEVPGGLHGQSLVINPVPPRADADGFIDHPVLPTDPEHWPWPPKGRSATNIMIPLKDIYFHSGLSHLSWLNLKNPPPGLPPASVPDVWITYRTNPAISMWDTPTVIEGIKRIPFHVSFAYELNETNEFADVILPDNMDLESLNIHPLTGQRQWENFWEHHGFAIRQPVVRPPFNSRDMTDILTDLAERVGMLVRYNETVNQFGGILGQPPLRTARYDYSLDPSKKHTAEEIFDRVFRAATMWQSDGKVEHGLEWFKAHGAFLTPFSRIEGFTQDGAYRRPWYLHSTMRKGGIRYNLPYQEKIKRIGVELGQRLHEKGIFWWDRQLGEYEALPKWHDLPGLFDTGPEYDLWLINCRSMQYSLGGITGIPLMFEAAGNVLGHDGVMINSKTARARGIAEGDAVWIESPLGRIKARAVLREGIHPEVAAVTHMFGHWKTPFARDLGWPNLNPLTPLSYERTSKSGSSSDHVKVKIYKE